ncbi:MAG: CPBP family intramembrane metalloprotease [Ruminococcus sp.]|jgi:membrane protease YdiL (CAAX protease family)|nr:CPBP family intramembrane metalloprotease [Ruminococcus sp.]
MTTNIETEHSDLDELVTIVESGAVKNGEITADEVIDRLTKDARSWRQGLRVNTSKLPEKLPAPAVNPFNAKNSNILNFALIAFAGMAFCVFITFLGELSELKYLIPATNVFASTIGLIPRPLIIVLMAVIAPLISEFLFRKFIFGALRRHTRFSIAAVVAALISGTVSGVLFDNIRSMPVQFVYAFCAGFFAAFVYEHTKSIWAAVIFHVFANAADIITSNIPDFPFDRNTAMIVMAISGVAAIYAFAALTFRLEEPFKMKAI